MKIDLSTAEIYIRADAIFLRFTFSVMMMVVVTMLVAVMPRLAMFRFVFMFMEMFMIMVMMLMFIMMLMVVMMFSLDLFLCGTFDFLNPCCGGCNILKVKAMSTDNVIERHIAIVAFDYTCFGLEGPNNALYPICFFGGDF